MAVTAGGSFSNPGVGIDPIISDPVLTPGVLTPDLSMAVLPTSMVAGATQRLSVPVTIANTGGLVERGTSTVALYASPDPSLDGTTTLLLSERRGLTVLPGKATTLRLSIGGLPAGLAAGDDYLIVQTTDADGTAAAATSDDTIAVASAFVKPTVAILSLKGRRVASTKAAADRVVRPDLALPTVGFVAGAGADVQAVALFVWGGSGFPPPSGAQQVAQPSAVIEVSNGGNVPINGPVTISLELTSDGLNTDGSLPSDATAYATVTRRLNVSAGKTIKTLLPVPTQSSAATGTYHLVAVVQTPGGDGAPALTSLTALTTTLTVE
jgi:hypothetical protein